MQFDAFKHLPHPQQIAYLDQYGRFLAEQPQDSFMLRLYACHSFFVEVWRIKDEDSILLLHVFQDMECLIPYLEKIILPNA